MNFVPSFSVGFCNTKCSYVIVIQAPAFNPLIYPCEYGGARLLKPLIASWLTKRGKLACSWSELLELSVLLATEGEELSGKQFPRTSSLARVVKLVSLRDSSLPVLPMCTPKAQRCCHQRLLAPQLNNSTFLLQDKKAYLLQSLGGLSTLIDWFALPMSDH